MQGKALSLMQFILCTCTAYVINRKGRESQGFETGAGKCEVFSAVAEHHSFWERALWEQAQVLHSLLVL